MAKINLLPWRERLREERKRQFLMCLLGTAFLALLIMTLVHLSISARINRQLERNAYLQQEINLLEGKVREISQLKEVKTALLARMRIVQGLQANRTLVVHLFNELVSVLPQGAHFFKVERKENVVNLSGRAESNGDISKFMRNIALSNWLADPILREIKADQNGKYSNEFTMSLKLTNPNAEKEVK